MEELIELLGSTHLIEKRLVANVESSLAKSIIENLINDCQIEIINIVSSSEITYYNIAALFYSLNLNKYIYNSKNKTWYVINEYGIYNKCDNHLLFEHLKSMVPIIYKKSNGKISLDKNIRRGFFINYVITELRKLYENNNIGELKKTKKRMNNIIIFNNGVYDFTQNKFRNALPYELIESVNGYKYDEPNKEIIDDVNNILSTIIPNSEELKYVLITIILSILNKTSNKIYIWNGIKTGQDILHHIIHKTFNNYLYEIVDVTKNTLLDHELAQICNKRIVTATLTDNNILHCNTLTNLTDEKPICARFLYGNSFKYVPKFDLIINTEFPPKITEYGKDLNDKIVLINFPKTTNKFSKVYDKFDDDEYKLAFFHILLDTYTNFKLKNEIKIPDRIKCDTREYLKTLQKNI